MEKKLNKIGELTSTQIVMTILVVVGLGIVIWFLISLNQNKPDKEVCRLSVVERSGAPFGKEVVPLKCTTEKVCITAKKSDKCKEFAGEDNIRSVVLDIPTGNKPRDLAKRKIAIKKIEEETANAMFDCWKMTGEGKLDIFGDKSVLKDVAQETLKGLSLIDLKPKCIVCSRIAISDSVKEKDLELREKDINYEQNSKIQNSPSSDNLFLDNVDVNNYMVANNVPGSTLSYLETFTDEGIGGYAEFSKEEAGILKTNSINEKPKKKLNQLALVFIQIKVPNITEKDVYWPALQTGLIVGGLAVLTGPGAIIRSVTGPIGWLYEAAAVSVGSHVYATEVQNTVKGNQLMATGTCDKYIVDNKKTEKLGCSLVRAIEWDVDKINKKCIGGIESNF